MKDLNKKLEQLVENKIIGIQVVDREKTLDALIHRGFKAKKSTKFKDEIDVDITNKNDRIALYKWMTTIGGWDKKDIEGTYPELLGNTMKKYKATYKYAFSPRKYKDNANTNNPQEIKNMHKTYKKFKKFQKELIRL